MPAICPTSSRGSLHVLSSRTSAGTLWSPPLIVSGSDAPNSGTLVSSQLSCPGVCPGRRPGKAPGEFHQHQVLLPHPSGS
eukprot:1727528-Rhodomonas_salina.3